MRENLASDCINFARKKIERWPGNKRQSFGVRGFEQVDKFESLSAQDES